MSKDSQDRITVGLLWHSLGSGNLGVGALTESNIAIVRGVAERLGLRVKFLVLGTSAATVPALAEELRVAGHALEVRLIRVLRPEFRAAVRECDLVLDIGEGDSFADIYGFRRFSFFWLSKNIVCSLGKPLILAPQTIGPFDGTVTRILAKQVMRRCTRVFARDELSSAYLGELGIRGNVDEATDVAFRLPFERPPVRRADGKIRFGINVSGLLFSGGYTGNNQFRLKIDYPATMRALLRDLSTRPEVEVHLVSHVIEPQRRVEDDVHAATTLAAEFPGVRLAPVFSRPSEAKSYIAGLDFFTGARMHACIAALASGVPVLPMAYSRKFSGLFGSLGYHRVTDCRTDDQISVIKKILQGLQEREAAVKDVQIALGQVSSRLARYEASLESALRKG